jgi:hypothetical protein
MTLPYQNSATEPVVQFDPAKLIALAKALKDEIEAQDAAMNAVALVDLYDAAGQMVDLISDLLHLIEKDAEEHAGPSTIRAGEYRPGGWGEV